MKPELRDNGKQPATFIRDGLEVICELLGHPGACRILNGRLYRWAFHKSVDWITVENPS